MRRPPRSDERPTSSHRGPVPRMRHALISVADLEPLLPARTVPTARRCATPGPTLAGTPNPRPRCRPSGKCPTYPEF